MEEEREKRLESMFEADMERPGDQMDQETAAKEAAEGATAPAGALKNAIFMRVFLGVVSLFVDASA